MELQGADYLNTAFAELRHLEPEALQALAQLAMCPPDTAALPPSMQEAPATERAARVDAVLEQQLRARRERVLAYAPFKRNLEEFGPDPDAEIEGQDTMPWGFHADPKWLHDIAAHIIEAKPLTIWLDNALVDIIPERSPTGRFTGFRPDHVEIARDSQTLLAGASLLQDVSAAIRSPRIRVMLQRSVGYTPQVEQVQEVLVLRALREQGIIDERGHDVGVLRLRDYEGRVGNIITLLQQNGGGQVYEGVGGVLLDQADWLQEWNRLRFAGHDGSRSKVPIQLTSGHASPWSAGFMSEADEGMHVVLGSGAYSVSADILKAAGSMKRDMFHMIGMREHWRGPEFRAYQLGRLLQREVRRYIKASSTVVDFNTFSAGDYMQKNYPEVMEQDKDIQRVQVRTAAKVAEQLGVDLERPETLLGDDEVLHVCVGSNLYPVMLREHLSAGRIKGIDIAPSVKRYMDRVRDGLHDGHWQLHEDEMVRAANECGIDPALFIGSRDRANQKLEVVIGDTRQLAPLSARMIEMHFGAEATSLVQVNFYEMLRAVTGALKDDQSVFEGVFTVGSQLWSDGVNLLPAVAMYENDYELAMYDCGLIIVDKQPIGRELSDSVKVRPGEDMVYYRAIPRPGTKPKRQSAIS